MLTGAFGECVLIGATLYDAVAGDLLRPATWPAIAASTYWCACFVLCLASILAPALIGIRRRGLWAEAKVLPLLPVYLLLMSWAAWRGLVELAFKPFHWSKTRHGLARSSRRRRPAAPSPTEPRTI